MSRIEPVFGSANIEIENLYKPSSANLIEVDATSFSTPKIFDFSGRISLSRYWLIHAPLVAGIPTALLVFFIIGLQHQLAVLALAVTTILLFSGLLSTSLLMRRSRDLGWSPVWGVVALLPTLGTLVFIVLSILPGQKSTNKYGSPNKALSTPIKITTCIIAATTFVGIILLFATSLEYLLPAINNITANISSSILK